MDLATGLEQLPRMDDTAFREMMIAALKDSGMSVAELSRRSGVTYDVINKLKRRESRSTAAENASAIAKVLGLPWDGARDSAEKHRPVPRPINHDVEAEDGETLVPVWDIEARAGHGAVVPEYEAVAHKLAFPPDYLRSITTVHPSNLEIISVKGKSMVPTLDNDDIVMIDRSKRQIGYDGVFVLRMDETLHVKRVARASVRGFVRIISDNRAEFPEFERAVSDIDVIGKVIWAGKRM